MSDYFTVAAYAKTEPTPDLVHAVREREALLAYLPEESRIVLEAYMNELTTRYDLHPHQVQASATARGVTYALEMADAAESAWWTGV